MTTPAAKAVKAALTLLMLLNATACVNTQSAPTMLDYSYVPPSHVTAATANYGIDDF